MKKFRDFYRASCFLKISPVNVSARYNSTQTVPVKEVQIPTQWGYVAGKLWGKENRRPILAVHGWQDNAGTWDPLAPMLAKGCSILAIDLPGHGLSSWFPPGMHYHTWEWPRLILFIKNYFQWDKLTFLAHSMGSIACSRYACLFPDDVDAYIAVDHLIYDNYDRNKAANAYGNLLLKLQRAQNFIDTEPPSYSMEEINKIWSKGTRNQVLERSVPYLAKRGTKPSKMDPNKYYFSRDSRLKYALLHPEDRTFTETLLARSKAPTLYFKATDSPFASDEFSISMRKIVEENNNKFEMINVPGTHHVHLNDPEVVAPHIITFLKKYNLYNENDNVSSKL